METKNPVETKVGDIKEIQQREPTEKEIEEEIKKERSRIEELNKKMVEIAKNKEKVNVPEHKHCLQCTKPMPVGEHTVCINCRPPEQRRMF